MTAVPEDWGTVVETLRSDLEAVSNGDAEDEDVRDAIDEVWGIVDAAEERLGSVDPEQIGDVLGVDRAGDTDAIDVDSISREFVLDDPQRAARLGRLVELMNVDEATDYEVGRLWTEDDAPAESTGDDPGGGADSSSRSTAEGESDRSTDGTGEAIRDEMSDALSELRDRIREAREGFDEATDSAAEAEDGGGTEEDSDEESDRDGTSSKRRSAARRGSGTLSTVPSRRRDMDGPSHLSTMPPRNGR